MREGFLRNGLASPLQWYRSMTEGVQNADSAGGLTWLTTTIISSCLIMTPPAIPKEAYAISKPGFFAACANDCICLAAIGKQQSLTYVKNLTVKDYDAGHWVQLEAPDQLNKDLEEWIQAIFLGS